MILLVLLLACTVATAGGFLVGVALGTAAERERATRRRRPAHEVLAEVYEFPTPAAILAELRGPLRGRAGVSIPVSALVRLLDNILEASGDAGTEQGRFNHWMRDGISLTPDLDLQDVATLARILAGERYDDIDGRPGPDRARP